MDFSDPMFLMPIICGPVFIVAGYVMLVKPPKWPNTLYGYRTPKAMANEKNWQFAQSYSAKELMKSGAIYTLLAVVSPFVELSETTSLILAIGLMLLFAAYPIIKTEKALNKLKP